MTSQRSDPLGFRREGKDLLRALAGGSIVGMPLLYTMEMWFHGATLSAWHQLAVLAAILGINFIFCRVSGFRHEHTLGDAVMQTFTSVGIAVIYSAVVLVLIGSIHRGSSAGESIGMILLEASAVSLGISFADLHFRGQSRTGEEQQQSGAGSTEQPPPAGPAELERRQLRADLVDVSATLVGSILFALNVAPTEEVLMIAARLNPWQLLLLLGATVVLCYVILYASGFETQPVHVQSIFQSAWAETAMTVGISLLAGLGLMLLLGEPQIMSHHSAVVGATIVLGLPATVGGAAGRLVT